MITNLNTALQGLRETLTRHPDIVPMLTREALEADFHGRNVSQVAKLLNAPALGFVETRRSDQGAAIELVLVDGADAELKAKTLRRLIVEGDPPGRSGDVQEYVQLDAGTVRETLLRDHNNVVYRLHGQQTVVDRDLTALAQRNRETESRLSATEGATPGFHRPLVIRDPIAVSATIGKVLQLIGELHRRDQEASQAARAIADAVAGATVTTAIETAEPDRIERMALALLETVRQSEAMLDELRRTVDAVIGMIDRAEPLHPHAPG